MSEDDANFDIDLYGDEESRTESGLVADVVSSEDAGRDTRDAVPQSKAVDAVNQATTGQDENAMAVEKGHTTSVVTSPALQASPQHDVSSLKTVSAQQTGSTQRSHPDDRPVDEGASSAIIISELPWYTNDDDIRGWANRSDCEAELKNVTFNEHKVNGKSKGQAYVEFSTLQAATALKRHIEALQTSQPGSKQYAVGFAPPSGNPFQTLSKDSQARGSSTTNRGSLNGRGSDGPYRGGRGGMGRGQMGGNMNNGFRGGFQGTMGVAGFNGNQMNSFNGGAFGNNFSGRGGMMMGNLGRGGRGGRGGMSMMPNMPMTGMMPGMNMAAMGMMPGMAANYGPNTMGNFGPPFFNSQQQKMGNAQGGGEWNPHGAKRPRES